jgi:hypothetical protein
MDISTGRTIGTYTPPLPRSRNRLVDLEGDTVVLPPPPDGETEWDMTDVREASRGTGGYSPGVTPGAPTASWTDASGNRQEWRGSAPKAAVNPDGTSRRQYKQLSAQQIAEAKANRLKASARAEADAEAKRLADAEERRARTAAELRNQELQTKLDADLQYQAGLRGLPQTEKEKTDAKRALLDDRILEAKAKKDEAAITQAADDAANPQYAALRALADRARNGDAPANARLRSVPAATLAAAKVDMSTVPELSAGEALEQALASGAPGERLKSYYRMAPHTTKMMDDILDEIATAKNYTPDQVADWRARLEDVVAIAPPIIRAELAADINRMAENGLRDASPAGTGLFGLFEGQRVGGKNRLLGSSGLQFGR